MNILVFPISYLFWHYSKALKNIFGIFSNFFWATYNFFSVTLIFKTFFSPWHKLDTGYNKNSGIEDFLGTLITNTLMRLVGMIIRLILLIIFVIFIGFLILLEITFLLAWLVSPFAVVWFVYNGIIKLI